jgi:ribosomal protein L11 methyltransferase
MRTTDWVEVCVQASVDAGELLGILDDPAVQGAWEEAGTIHLYWPEDQWNGDRLASVQTVLRRMNQAGMADIPVSVDRVPFQDWNQLWARSVKPLWIGKRIVVRPSWEPVSLQPGQIEIILDPKQAFGTGHHATTRMLLEWLEEIVRGGESVLDIGTGSGLLAMAALRLGAVRAVGIDHDPVAIECAQDYARQNRFGEELSLQCGGFDAIPKGQSFDLVLANLDRQTLLQLAERLTDSTHPKWLISGLLLDQREEIVSAFAAAGLYPGRQREQDGWLAMEFLHAQSCEGV